MSIAGETSAGLRCHHCGYDLRAQPEGGKCPECGESTDESRRRAAIPLRPTWQESDRRWRRRVLAGLWVLALLPLVDVLRATKWAEAVPTPGLFQVRHDIRTLDQTLLFDWSVYEQLTFCVGLALLCAKERGRPPGRLDWASRWGLLCAYVTLLISAASKLFIVALVLVGIAAMFLSMPIKYTPTLTPAFLRAGTSYLWYGPQPKPTAYLVQTAASSLGVMLACVPLYHALYSTGLRRWAALGIAPLVAFTLLVLFNAGRYLIDPTNVDPYDVFRYEAYFNPSLIVPGSSQWFVGTPAATAVWIEAIKYGTILLAAIWLTVSSFRRQELRPLGDFARPKFPVEIGGRGARRL